MKIGYARVSSTGQNLEAQLAALEQAECERIYQEKRSGTSTDDREELERALDVLRAGDVLVVTRLDRLARSVGDLHAIVARITQAGAGFQCLTQGSVDTTTSTGKLMLSILGAVAEFENDIRRERQAEGIAKAKENGVYKRRRGSAAQKRIDRERLAELAPTMGATAIADEMKISRASVYRILEEIEAEKEERGRNETP